MIARRSCIWATPTRAVSILSRIKAHWAEQRTDTAFPPYWFLTSLQGRNILEDELNVAKSIGVHVPLKVPEELKNSGADYLSVSGETREIGPGLKTKGQKDE